MSGFDAHRKHMLKAMYHDVPGRVDPKADFFIDKHAALVPALMALWGFIRTRRGVAWTSEAVQELESLEDVLESAALELYR